MSVPGIFPGWIQNATTPCSPYSATMNSVSRRSAIFDVLISAQTRHHQVSTNAANIDDLLVTPSEQEREEGAGNEIGATEVGVPSVPPSLRIAISDRGGAPNHASIVDKDIQASKLLADLLSRALDAFLVRYVDLDAQHLRRVLLDCSCGVLDVFLERSHVRAGTYRNAGNARSGERYRDGSSNSFGRTANADILAMEIGLAGVDGGIGVAVEGFGEVVALSAYQS